ncbi:hypothetical protein ACQKM9_17360 [Viridibacillus sp. NPDC093762]|uniref:hypothetical protein n=1 Tax=Viridibacillus sp. NPDC093762 TaxID=3390720 RepID=UPI003CFE0F0D
MKKLTKRVMLIMLLVFSFSGLQLGTVQAATPKNVDFSIPIKGDLKTASKSYKFEVTYKTDYMIASYLGNSVKENENYVNDYSLEIYNAKNKLVATSSRTSYYNEVEKRFYMYQLIDKQLTKGKYTLKVKVKNPLSTKQQFTITTDSEVYGGTVSISSLKANKKSPQLAKTKITLSTKAKGSYLKYQYSVTNTKTNKRTVLRKYSSNKTATWKPTKAGTYKILVTVKNTKSGKTTTKSMAYKVKSKK